MFLKKYLSTTPENEQKTEVIAYLASLDHIEKSSPIISERIVQELKDQRSYLKLIASENFSSLAVQLSMGNLLTDKYAEGYAHHRFYAGCNNIDLIEEEAIHQLKKLFNCEYAFVQPHSGVDANLIAFFSILVDRIQNKEVEKLGHKSIDTLSSEELEKIRQLMMNQKLMGMSLNSGGHLTHGYKHNLSSKIMKAVSYEVNKETELLDYAAIKQQAIEEKPLILLAGYSAYPRKINFRIMREIAEASGSVLMVDMAHFSGLVAGKAFTGDFDPIPHAHIVTSTTHKTLRGPRGGIILSSKDLGVTIDKACPLAMGGPLPQVIAAKAIAFKEANSPDFQKYAAKIIENAQTLSDAFIKANIKVTTNGTDNHLVIVDVSQFSITGRQAEIALRQAHLTLNRNTVPFDLNGPWYTSGIRLGTPALTTLGMGKEEMTEIASIIIEVLKNTKKEDDSKAKCHVDPHVLDKSKQRVQALLNKFPVYPEIVLD
jgi:glycine hydroxymethyltransferase